MQKVAQFYLVSASQFNADCQKLGINASQDGLVLPKRATTGSAGYDFYSPLSFTLAPGETLTAAYNAFKADAAGAAALEQAFAAEMPFIPLLWKNGAVTASRRITGLTPSLSDPFYSLQQLAPANR